MDGGGDEDAALRDATLRKGPEGIVFDVSRVLGLEGSAAAVETPEREIPAARNGGAAGVLTLLDSGQVAGYPAIIGIKLHRGTSQPPTAWKRPDFDDSSWETVDQTPIGYPAQPYLLDDMQGGYTTFYVRIRFRITDHPEFDARRFSSLQAELGVDDGFIAYLSGASGEYPEVGRLGLDPAAGSYGSGAEIKYDALASRPNDSEPPVSVYTDLFHSSFASSGSFEPEIDPSEETVLAIQVLNVAVSDADCILAPRLLLRQRGPFVVRAGVDTTQDPQKHSPTDVELVVRGAPDLAASGTRAEYRVGGVTYWSDTVEVEVESEADLYTDESTYRIRLPGKEAGHPEPNPPLPLATDVEYRVSLGGDLFHDDYLTFRTPAAFGESFSCLLVGNSGVATPEQADLAAMLEGESSELFISAGDFVIRNNFYQEGSVQNEYREPALTNQSVDHLFYHPFAANLASSVLYQIPGDEDLETETSSANGAVGDYDLSVAMPEREVWDPDEEPGGTTEKYYSFDHGCVHFTMLQTTKHNDVVPTYLNAASLGRLSTEIEFIKSDLLATRKLWKVVVLHHPPYTSKERYLGGMPGSTPSDDRRFRTFLEQALDIDGDDAGGFEELGVDLVISAHSPFFEQTSALRTNPDGSHEIVATGPDFVDPGAPVYVMTGGGGEPLYACLPGEPLCEETALEEFTEVMLREHHAVRLTVDENVLSLEAIGVDGEVLSSATITKTTFPDFRRGDSNQDGSVGIADANFSLNQLFLGGPAPHCLDAADADDSGSFNISDAVFTLNWLFQGGAPPPAPGPSDCGGDPTPDDLTCLEYIPECP